MRPGALGDPANRAYLEYAGAVAAGRDGRPEDAAAAFGRADELMRPGWQRQHARMLAAEAAARDGWGTPGAWASEALAFFQKTGLPGFAAQAKAVMRRAGTPVPRRGRGTAALPEALRSLGITSRESEVLAFVGEGLSNEEIGRRLFLSPRTVETHVTSLLRKTGSPSRLQLVAFAGRHAPAGPE
jgi:DNA-binding CsgD family transcriptional regulator